MPKNREEILKEAIEKAVKNTFFFKGADYKKFDEDNQKMYFHKLTKSNRHWRIIFSHDFAKAFFPGRWKEHLQSMVILEKPIKYLEKFL